MEYNKDGLNQRQIDRINFLIRTQKYKPAKVAALVNEFRKKNAANPELLNGKNVGSQDSTPILDPTSPVNDKTGEINTPELISDMPKQLNSEEAQRKAYEANYNFMTKDLEYRKAYDLEQQKQELANRGIPYDPSNTESLYGRTLHGVNSRYDSLYNDAKNQALIAANQTASTNAGIDKGNTESFLQAIGLSSGANQGAYGIKTQKQLEEEKIRLQREALRKQGSGGGGGGGSSSGGGFSIAGSISE